MNTNANKLPEVKLTEAQIIQANVSAELDALKINVSIVPAGTGLIRDGWECDGWRVILRKGKVQESFNFYTGIGHRVLPEKDYRVKNLRDLIKGAKKTLYRNNLLSDLNALACPVKPHIASVLYGLVLDSSAQDESFTNWCANYGYETDSIKALNIYRACLENAEKLNRLFSRAELAAISELLQDY